MNVLGKSEDRAIDRLLRAQVGRQGASCSGLDADLANAYVEGALSRVETARYESHLSECVACRRAVARLIALQPADLHPNRPIAKPAVDAAATAIWAERLKRLFATLRQPRWAIAATALLALAVSIPVLLSLNRERSDRSTYDLADQRPASASSTPAQPGAEATEPAGPTQTTPARPVRNRPVETQAKDKESVPAGTRAPAAAGVVGRMQDTFRAGAAEAASSVSKDTPSAQSKKAEAGNKTKLSEPDRLVAEKPEAAPPPAKEEQKQLGRIDQKKALTLSEEGGKAVEARVLRPGMVGDQPKTEREKPATIRPADAVAKTPEAPAPGSSGRKVLTSGPAAQPSNERGANKEAARSRRCATPSKLKGTAERRIANKTFRLVDGVWTDKDYKPDKELPAVTLVRDSDVYQELLAKQTGLKPYLGAFAAAERLIVVYKGTVYKVVPPEKQEK